MRLACCGTPSCSADPSRTPLATPLTDISIAVDSFAPRSFGPIWRSPAGPVSPVPEEVQ